MDGRYRIRPATDRDLAEVVAIEQGAFSDPWSEESFRSLLTHHAFVVVVNDREIVGYVFGVGVEDVGEILNVAVAHAHRQRGIGRALVEHARHSLVRSGVRQVFLEPPPRHSTGHWRSSWWVGGDGTTSNRWRMR
jgi:ribosomal protein S18 acetylase RimI-like enzyme